MTETKHAELEKRKKHTKLEEQIVEGTNHELKESLREDIHETTVMQEIEIAAAAKDK